MKPTPKVSIIVPVYNVEPHLRQCMDSLINQTYRNIEIICVNDGATDESGEILAEYAAKDSTIKVISQKNAGLSAARNVGFSFATGDYVMYVDSDDWIDLETCETAVAIAVKHKRTSSSGRISENSRMRSGQRRSFMTITLFLTKKISLHKFMKPLLVYMGRF